jgi:hypothetical protein
MLSYQVEFCLKLLAYPVAEWYVTGLVPWLMGFDPPPNMWSRSVVGHFCINVDRKIKSKHK